MPQDSAIRCMDAKGAGQVVRNLRGRPRPSNYSPFKLYHYPASGSSSLSWSSRADSHGSVRRGRRHRERLL